MRTILSAMGRTFLRDGIAAFAVFGIGIWQAGNFEAAKALAIAASYAALAAAFRGIRVYVPGLSTAVANTLGVPISIAEVVIAGLTTLISGTLVGITSFFEAPDTATGKAALIAAMLGIGTSMFRLVSAFFTPGEAGGGCGISTPAQPVHPASLPDTLPTNPNG